MGIASGLIAQARKSLGTTEHPPGSNHNYIVEWYNANVDRIGDGAWCDMSVTMWAALSGNAKAVGAFAYTVWHAEWFQAQGRWHYGTDGIQPGDVVFFDWSGSRRIGNIDHVGIVEKVDGGDIYTIEGNSGDVCKRQVRDSTYIVGYGRPAYDKPKPDYWTVTKGGKQIIVPWATPFLQFGTHGTRVKWLQVALNATGAKLAADGEFMDKTEAALRLFQKTHKDENGRKLEVDGVYGHHTARSLFIALGGKREDAV